MCKMTMNSKPGITLEDFHISRSCGFLLDTPLTTLPVELATWEELAQNLPGLVETKYLREKVHQMSVLDHRLLTGYREKRLAHLMLTAIASCYIWQEGDEGVPQSLPECLAVPWCGVSHELGLNPSLSHSDLVLANWKLSAPDKPFCLDNLDWICQLPGGDSSKWFVLITIQMEKVFTEGLLAIEAGIHAVCCKDDDGLTEALWNIQQVIVSLKSTFSLMHERVKPDHFYNKLRPFLSGWGGQDSPLPDGLIYSGVSPQPKQFTGGSAAQSSIFQTLDAFLGVGHSDEKNQFLVEMRKYMPPDHRRFIETLEKGVFVRQYVLRSGNKDLEKAYKICLETLIDFRSYHIQIVTKYVVVMSQKKGPNNMYDSVSKRGTGGSSLIPFLKNVRSATEKARIPDQQM